MTLSHTYTLSLTTSIILLAFSGCTPTLRPDVNGQDSIVTEDPIQSNSTISPMSEEDGITSQDITSDISTVISNDISTNIPILDTTTSYSKPSPEKEALYKKTMHGIGLKTKEDPAYQHIAFDSKEEKKWFRMLTYQLWDRQITRQQFISQSLEKYPQHKYEFEFIVRELTQS
jgi:hypothetical protein